MREERGLHRNRDDRKRRRKNRTSEIEKDKKRARETEREKERARGMRGQTRDGLGEQTNGFLK